MEIDTDVDALKKLEIIDTYFKRLRWIGPGPMDPHHPERSHADFLPELLKHPYILIGGRREVERIRKRVDKKGKARCKTRIQEDCRGSGKKPREDLHGIERVNLRRKNPEIVQAVGRRPGCTLKINGTAKPRLHIRRRTQPRLARQHQNRTSKGQKYSHTWQENTTRGSEMQPAAGSFHHSSPFQISSQPPRPTITGNTLPGE